MPGHKGIAGDKLPDKLARSAASTGTVHCGWSSYPQGGESRQGETLATTPKHAPSLSRFKYVINLPRNNIFQLLIAFYTNYCKLKKYLYKMGLASCVNSRFCDMESENLLIGCTAVCIGRIKDLGSMFPNRDHIAS